MADYNKGYNNADDVAKQADQAYQNAGRNVANAGRAANKAGKMYKAAKAAENGKKVAAAAKAAKGAATVLSWKVIAIIALVLVAFVLILCVIELMPSIVGNSFLHTNDPETLSDNRDITSVESFEESVELMKEKTEQVKETTTKIFEEAYADTYNELKSLSISPSQIATYAGGSAEVFIDMSRLPTRLPTAIEEDATVLIACAYSAAMKNAISEEAFEYYQGVTDENEMLSSATDFRIKLSSLLDKENVLRKYGNYIFGGDFATTADGKIIPVEEEVITYTYVITEDAWGVPIAEFSSAQSTQNGELNVSNGGAFAPSGDAVTSAWSQGKTTVTTQRIIYHVEPLMFQTGWKLLFEEAFGVELDELYDPDFHEETTYHDMVVEMCNLLGRELYGEVWVPITEITNVELALNDPNYTNLYTQAEYFYYITATHPVVLFAMSQLHRGGTEEIALANEYQKWYIDFAGGNSSIPGDWQTYNWCAIFVSWIFYQLEYFGKDWEPGTRGDHADFTTYPDTGVSNAYRNFVVATARVNEFYRYFKARGEFFTPSERPEPEPGDLIIIERDGDEIMDHIAVVVETVNGKVIVAGGNQRCSDHGAYEVTMVSYQLDDERIFGYCTPDYPADYIDQDVYYANWIKEHGYNGCDTAAYISTQKQAEEYAAVFQYIGRYIGYPEDMGAKVPMDKAELDRLLDAGLGVQIIYEENATDTLQGAPKGQELGAKAAQYAFEELDLPEGTVIYFCHDEVANPSDYEAIKSFLEAAKAECAKYGYKIGIYGPYNIVDWLADQGGVCDAYWQTLGWSEYKVSDKLTSYQASGCIHIDGVAYGVDLNTSADPAQIGAVIDPSKYYFNHLFREVAEYYNTRSERYDVVPNAEFIMEEIEKWFAEESIEAQKFSNWLDKNAGKSAVFDEQMENFLERYTGQIVNQVTSDFSDLLYPESAKPNQEYTPSTSVVSGKDAINIKPGQQFQK